MRQSGLAQTGAMLGAFSELPMRQSGRPIQRQVIVTKRKAGEKQVFTLFLAHSSSL